MYSQQDAEECWSSILQTLCREVPAIDDLFGLQLKMSLKNESTGETREEVKKEYNFKCNITINVNHLSEGFSVALSARPCAAVGLGWICRRHALMIFSHDILENAYTTGEDCAGSWIRYLVSATYFEVGAYSAQKAGGLD